MTAVDVKGLEAAISAQQELVERQGDVVRSLKAEVKEGKVLKHEVDAAIEKLKGLKLELDGKLKEFQVRETRCGRGGRYGGVRRGAGGCRGRPPSHQPRPWGSRLRPSSIPAHALTRSHAHHATTVLHPLLGRLPPGNSLRATKSRSGRQLVNVLERKLFYIPAFKIYGGVAGLYDYGPPGCADQAERDAVLAPALCPGGEHARDGVSRRDPRAGAPRLRPRGDASPTSWSPTSRPGTVTGRITCWKTSWRP